MSDRTLSEGETVEVAGWICQIDDDGDPIAANGCDQCWIIDGRLVVDYDVRDTPVPVIQWLLANQKLEDES